MKNPRNWRVSGEHEENTSSDNLLAEKWRRYKGDDISEGSSKLI